MDGGDQSGVLASQALASTLGDTKAVSEAEDELRSLMEAYQEGEIRAFEALYRRLAPQILSYLRWKALDASLAEDLLQEVFLQVHRSRRTYQPPRPVKPWVFAIARYVYLMDRRARSSRLDEERIQPEDTPDLPVPAEAERMADRELVREALRRVSADRREPFLLHHLWGFSFDEIGRILGISGGAAKVRSHRALKELRGILDREGRP